MANRRHVTHTAQSAEYVDDVDDVDINFDDLPPVTSGVTTGSDADVDLTDDLPEEMNDESPTDHSGDETPFANMVGLSLEELNTRTLDDQRDEQERSKIDPPRGDWLKTERFEYEIRCNGTDKMPGDMHPAGRVVINMSGYPNERTVEGQTYRPMLFMRLSPDRRFKNDGSGKHDNAYKMWLFARDLYLEIHERRHKEIGDIILMLEDEEYIITTMRGDTGPVAIGLKHRDHIKRRNRRMR